jgi:hypothetical protein
MSELEEWVVLTWVGCDGVKCDDPQHCEDCKKVVIGTPGLLARCDWDSQSENSPIKRVWKEVPDAKELEDV